VRKKVKNEGKIGMFREQKNLLPRFLNFYTQDIGAFFLFVQRNDDFFVFIFVFIFVQKVHANRLSCS